MWVDVEVDPSDRIALAKLIDDGVIQPVQAVEMILAAHFPYGESDLTDIARRIVNVLQY